MKPAWCIASLLLLGLGTSTARIAAEVESDRIPGHALGEREFVREWVVLGAFPNRPVDREMPDGSFHFGYATDFLVDLGGESNARLSTDTTISYEDSEGQPWRATARFLAAELNGSVDLNDAFDGSDHEVAYAYTTIRSNKEQKATFLFGSDDGAKVWINGELVHSIYAGRGLSFAEDRFQADLQKGENHVLVKVADRVREWGFALEALDPDALLLYEGELKERHDFEAFLDSRIQPDLGNEWDYTFGPGPFPELVWEKPYLVREVLGEVPITARWFDSDLTEVTSAESPGRYLWIADANSPDGLHIRRGGTLFCRPDDWYGWSERPKAHLEFLPLTTVNQTAWKEYEEATSDFAGRQMLLSILRQEEGAILMSFLHEIEATGKTPSPVDTPSIRDQEAHLALKRKLMGVQEAYPELVRPRLATGPSAPELRRGSPEEAGIAPGTDERIREVARAWFEDSGEPFDLLVARHGVIVVHEAFGNWPWGDMTVDTPKPVASITKLITGTLFALFVDQDLIEVDDRVGDFLPDFPVEGERVATLRQCFTHTTGLWGHQEWRGLHNPYMENVAANAMSRSPVGKVHSYNGMGYDLAGRVMEVASGKSVFRLMYEHLFSPLGLKNTTLEEDLGFSCNTTAYDLAVIAQLLLNRGSYGDLEFFSPETFEQLLPQPLQRFYPEIDQEWGIGLTWMLQPHPGAGSGGIAKDATILSKNVVGHGSATSSILRIDLDNDLVITQTRRIGGKGYEDHLEKLLLAIEAGLK